MNLLFLTIDPMGNSLSTFGVVSGLGVVLVSICHGVKVDSPFASVIDGTVSGDELPAVVDVDTEFDIKSMIFLKLYKQNITESNYNTYHLHIFVYQISEKHDCCLTYFVLQS